jgi:hypothetical protein
MYKKKKIWSYTISGTGAGIHAQKPVQCSAVQYLHLSPHERVSRGYFEARLVEGVTDGTRLRADLRALCRPSDQVVAAERK